MRRLLEEWVDRLQPKHYGGHINPRKEPPMPTPVTPKQANFIAKLINELADKGWAPTEEMSFIPYSRHHASQLIDWLITKNREVKAPTAQTATEPEVGYYVVDGEVYRVQANKAGTNSYAKVLRGTGWEYVGKSPYRSLTPEARLSYDQAREHGLRTGSCLICGIHLENTESAQYGIGPSCYKNLTGMSYAQARKAGELPPVVKPQIQAAA